MRKLLISSIFISLIQVYAGGVGDGGGVRPGTVDRMLQDRIFEITLNDGEVLKQDMANAYLQQILKEKYQKIEKQRQAPNLQELQKLQDFKLPKF